MTTQELGICWVDFAILILLLVGVVRGRKRGMSQELLDIIKWGLIVVVAGFAYLPLGQLLAQTNVLNPLLSYLAVYTAVALIIFITFAFIRGQVGEKLMVADKFGDGEYYLGMVAGAFRYTCVIIVAMAFLNARYYTPAELAKARKAQLDALGSDFFPSWGDLQQEVFHNSAVGRFTKETIPVLLIKPTGFDGKSPDAEKKPEKSAPARRERKP